MDAPLGGLSEPALALSQGQDDEGGST